MTTTSPSVLVVFLLLSLCFAQRIGAVPVESDVPEEERKGENEVREPDTHKTVDEIILDAYGGPEAEKAAKENRLKELGVETEGMDTLLTPEQIALLNYALHSEGRRFKRRRPFFVTPWTGGVVPYDLRGLPAQYRRMMIEAFREWERNTCVRFVRAGPNHQNRLVFTTNSGCSSYLGMISSRKQAINLGNGCHFRSTYLHELGHALGLVHEHQLPQRDRYIYVETANVLPRYLSQFVKYPASQIPNAERVTYSLRSIMHYGKHVFAKRPDLQTIFARDRSQEHLMGTSRALVPSDIQVINLMYNCNVGK